MVKVFVFEQDGIFESTVDKWRVKCKLESRHKSCIRTSIVIRQQFSKNREFQSKLWIFLNLSAKYNNVHRKVIRT